MSLEGCSAYSENSDWADEAGSTIYDANESVSLVSLLAVFAAAVAIFSIRLFSKFVPMKLKFLS